MLTRYPARVSLYLGAALRGYVLRTAIWGPKPHGFAPKPPASFHYVEMIRASGRLTTLVSTWIASLRTLKSVLGR